MEEFDFRKRDSVFDKTRNMVQLAYLELDNLNTDQG